MGTIMLTEPLRRGDGTTVTDLTFRPPRVKDMKSAQRRSSDTAEQELALVAAVCGLVAEDLEEMLLADYQRLLAEIFPGRTSEPT